MGLADDLRAEVAQIFRDSWGDIPKGQVVPDPKDLRLGNDGKHLDATVLYADLVGSTKLVDSKKDWFAAEVYKTFLTCAARIIKMKGGVITAYDGDRIMAVFVEGTKNTNAVKAALHINWAVREVVSPALQKQYPHDTYVPRHVVGVDTSTVLVSRVGVRNDNDLVWIGRAANHAAKLCDRRVGDYRTWITKSVYDQMLPEARVAGDGRNMWAMERWEEMGNAEIYGSTWWWGL